MTTKTATKIKPDLPKFSGTAHLYRVDPPLEGHEYVIVSATTLPIPEMFPDIPDTETYIFPGTPDGEIADWGELDGSYKGGLDHDKALGNAGYEVTA